MKQAEREFPNGYADYIAKFPEDTPESWELNLDLYENQEMHITDFWTIKTFADMADWDNNRLWAFLGWLEFKHNKGK